MADAKVLPLGVIEGFIALAGADESKALRQQRAILQRLQQIPAIQEEAARKIAEVRAQIAEMEKTFASFLVEVAKKSNINLADVTFDVELLGFTPRQQEQKTEKKPKAKKQ